eukprot:jgi/Botrbrau1/18487/Bobra.0072s0067.1
MTLLFQRLVGLSTFSMQYKTFKPQGTQNDQRSTVSLQSCKRLWAVAYPVSKQTGRKFVPLQLQSLTTVCSFRHMQLHEQDWHPYVPSIFPNQFRYMLICQ